VERRLTTILSIDVVGYSRLMERNEAATLTALKAHRTHLIDPVAEAFGGKTIKLMGDGALMEFVSAVEAVSFAVTVQHQMLSRNVDVPEHDHIEFRIGINIGDVISEDGDIHGDGVNVAARLEKLAESGGICIHRSVRDQVHDKLNLNFEDLGEIEVKNIVRPVPVIKVKLDEKSKAHVSANVKQPNRRIKSKSTSVLVGIGGSILAALAFLFWSQWTPETEYTDPATASQSIPTAPSIVVLPFDNRSDDPEIGYLAEGFSTAITTQLSKFPQLFVIAGSTAITFADTSIRTRDIGRELGVRYVLSGSIQKGSRTLSMNAALVEAETEHTAWSDQYEFSVADVFATQADFVQEITSTLEVEIEREEIAALKKQPTDVSEAYELYLRAVAKSKLLSTASRQEAIEFLKQAVALDPEYLAAHIELSGRYLSLWRFGGSEDPETALAYARHHLSNALELDQADYRVQHRLGQVQLFADHDHELAYGSYQRALQANPNDPEVLYDMGFLRFLMGEPAEAIDWNNKAKRVNPRYPGWYNFNAALSHFFIKDYEQALLLAKAGTSIYPKSLPPRRILVATLAEMGRLEEAQEEAKKLLKIRPDFRISTHRNTPFLHQEDEDRYFDAMKAGGLPE
jgi:adenylate cyclase